MLPLYRKVLCPSILMSLQNLAQRDPSCRSCAKLATLKKILTVFYYHGVCVCVRVQLMEAYKTLESECQKSQVAAVETEKKLSRKLREMSEVQELNQLVSLSLTNSSFLSFSPSLLHHKQSPQLLQPFTLVPCSYDIYRAGIVQDCPPLPL